jgi:flagellin
MISILNSISNLTAENALSSTQANLQNTLTELSTGLRINSGSDDPAGLSIADGLGANISALNQSSQNASDGVGLLQTADGALSQVTTLLDTAVTLATEASDGGLSTSQATALDTEFQSILNEIGTIGSTTNYNGTGIFGTTATVYTSDGTSAGSNTISTAISALTTTALGLNNTNLTSTANAQSALSDITSAISTIAANRGSIGSAVNQLQAASNVESTELTNLTAAQNTVQNADIGTVVSQMTQYNILEQTGMEALSQSQAVEKNVLTLFQ